MRHFSRTLLHLTRKLVWLDSPICSHYCATLFILSRQNDPHVCRSAFSVAWRKRTDAASAGNFSRSVVNRHSVSRLFKHRLYYGQCYKGWVFFQLDLGFWCRLGFWAFCGQTLDFFVALQVFSAFYYHFTDDTNLWHWDASCSESTDIYFVIISHIFHIFYPGYWDPANTSHAGDATPLANIVTYLSLLIRWRHNHSCEATLERHSGQKTLNIEQVGVADSIEIDYNTSENCICIYF